MPILGTPIPPSLATGPHFAVGGAIFGDLQADHIAQIANQGFPGIEPYRGLTMQWIDRPNSLKDVLDRHGVTMVTCSNGGPGQSTNFIDPTKRQQTIDDHLAFARDFLTVFGCRHFKINMGARPHEATTDQELREIAATIDDLAKRTFDIGITLAPHPHIWGPIERPEEVRRLMELTDPHYVGLIVDTGQINLGGGDPLDLIDTYYERIPALHWKDSKASYRGYVGPTPSIEQHQQEILYKDLGAGGVDLIGIWALLQKRGYAGWITLDLDPPRPLEGEGSVDDKMAINRAYLLDRLRVAHI